MTLFFCGKILRASY